MFSIKTLSILAIAGTAIAAPQGWGSWGGVGEYLGNGGNRGGNDDNKGSNNNVATDVAVVTYYTTVTQHGQGQFGGGYQPETSTPVATSAPAMQTWAPVASAPASSAAPAAPVGTGYMGVVSEWRSKMGMSQLTESSTLVANAQKTVDDSNGQMVHELNPGSFAQVLAPGSADDFEKVFVGGWLCEVPSLPGLDGICSSMSQGWSYDGQTGHADILSSTKYSKIGCALAAGIWACDLA